LGGHIPVLPKTRSLVRDQGHKILYKRVQYPTAKIIDSVLASSRK